MWLRNGVRSCNDMLITSAKEVMIGFLNVCALVCSQGSSRSYGWKTVAVMVQLNLDPRVWGKCLDRRAALNILCFIFGKQFD